MWSTCDACLRRAGFRWWTGLVLAAALILLIGCGGVGAAGTSGGGTQATSTVVYGWGHAAGNGGVGSGHHQKHSGGAGGKIGSTTPTRIAGISGSVVQISTSNSDSYALTSSGAVWAWGAGADGELGDGRTAASASAVRVDFPSGVRITSLPNPMPYDGGLALDSDHQVFGWGNDTYHQLCLPGTSNVTEPQRLPLDDVTLAVGAARHTLFDASGTLEGCGWNRNGDLGDGTTVGGQSTPTRVQGLPSSPIEAITASWGDEGVLYRDGDFYDWGFDQAGQAGIGTTAVVDTAVRVQLPTSARQVSEGGSVAANGTTLALLTNGSTWVWGDGSAGQIGNGGTANALSPTQLTLPSGVQFTLVNAGGASCYGLDQQGRLWAWGSGGAGQLGRSGGGNATRPVDIGLHLHQVSSTAANVAGYAQA